jgi:aspartyl-tRNA(Asn)/glutamyl-tRNA(Gln) amidotransferase subunit C
MAIDRDTVRRIARLARIAVRDDELDHLSGEIGRIIDWVEQLDSLDTASVQPMTSAVRARLPMREDVVTDGFYAEKLLANAPVREAGFFVVPKVVE